MTSLAARGIPSGGTGGSGCDYSEDCTGYRTWEFPNGTVINGHCGCAVGREKAAEDFTRRYAAARRAPS